MCEKSPCTSLTKMAVFQSSLKQSKKKPHPVWRLPNKPRSVEPPFTHLFEKESIPTAEYVSQGPQLSAFHVRCAPSKFDSGSPPPTDSCDNLCVDMKMRACGDDDVRVCVELRFGRTGCGGNGADHITGRLKTLCGAASRNRDHTAALRPRLGIAAEGGCLQKQT